MIETGMAIGLDSKSPSIKCVVLDLTDKIYTRGVD